VEEHQLVIHKILSGVPVQTPVAPVYTLTNAEIEASESMLNGLMQNWPGFENTSIDGLRESFLQSEGRLQKSDEQWTLTVQVKAFDVLLDRVPWSISMIKLPWMKKLLRVEWR
jgi:hypothetical protein